MKSFFLIFFTLFLITCFGQQKNYDSLELRFAESKADTSRLGILAQLVNTFFETDLNKALDYARQGVILSENLKDKNWLPRFYEMQGRMHANLLQLDSADVYFDKALTGYLLVKDKKGQATTAFKKSWLFKKRGELDKAMELDLQALRIMESLNDLKGMADAYNRVAEDLTRQDRLKEAMDYVQKAIAICNSNNFKTELAYCYFSGGNVAIAGNEAVAALDYYSKAVVLGKDLGFGLPSMSDFYNARGNSLKKLVRYNEALDDYGTAYTIAKESNYANAIYTTIGNMGEVNLLLGNYKEALVYQLETVRLQELGHDLSNLTENYGHVSTIYEKMGNYKEALIYQKKALQMRDSVASVKSDEAMSKMLTQYETKKKEATIQTQQNQLTQQNKIQWLGIIAVALMAILLLVLYISYSTRTRRNRLLAAKNAENELLLKEIHHRVKNNLEVVSSLLELQSAQIDDPSTKDAIQESQNRVHSIGIVHQKLYQGNTLGSIEMKDYFLNLGDSILDSFGADERITIELAMEKINIDIDTAVPLGLIVNELLTNTVKYAFTQGQSGRVCIKLEKHPNNILHLEVSDNGIGKSAEIKGTGFGTQLISLLTRQLNGVMKEQTGSGTHHYFDFKLKAAY